MVWNASARPKNESNKLFNTLANRMKSKLNVQLQTLLLINYEIKILVTKWCGLKLKTWLRKPLNSFLLSCARSNMVAGKKNCGMLVIVLQSATPFLTGSKFPGLFSRIRWNGFNGFFESVDFFDFTKKCCELCLFELKILNFVFYLKFQKLCTNCFDYLHLKQL